MSFKRFIQQANEYGKQRRPFFFLIDFEQQKPLIFPLEQTLAQGIYFDLQEQRNIN